jgi:hypothetical protein
MTYRGKVEGGVIVLEQHARLPEGTKVNVEPVSSCGMTLAEEFKDFIGKATDLPEDFAENHDHYLYGTPKR